MYKKSTTSRLLEGGGMKFVYDDGGRLKAGFKGKTGDCVVRAIAITSNKSYQEVYDDLFSIGKKTPREGVERKTYEPYIKSLGFKWVPCMKIGTGCKVHLLDEELPVGILIARVSKHLTAIINRVIHDTHDPQRVTHWYDNEGKVKNTSYRCVYGYYIKED